MVTYMPGPGDGTPRPVTLVPDCGIGPLVTGAMQQVMDAMHAPLYFETNNVHGDIPAADHHRPHQPQRLPKGGLSIPVGRQGRS